MKKVLVLGSTGMLGHMVVRLLSREASLTVDRTQRTSSSEPNWFDAEMGYQDLRILFEKRGVYQYIINCVGVTNAGINEGEPISVRRAIKVNAVFPQELATFAAEVGARVIHISTDGVFAGTADAYLEDAAHDCTDIYGKTKSLGEVRTPAFLTIRCSIIGPDPIGKRGLIEWFRAQPDGSEIMGYTDHLWNGVTTYQFAELCQKIIIGDRFDSIREESSVHHFCPNQPVSKYELLEILKSVFKKDVTIKASAGLGVPVRRILMTKYKSLRVLFGCDLSMESVVSELYDTSLQME